MVELENSALSCMDYLPQQTLHDPFELDLLHIKAIDYYYKDGFFSDYYLREY
jgi:hypothetical protein